MFIISGEDLAANRAFLERIDRPEDVTERVCIGCYERAPAGKLRQLFKEGDIRALDFILRRALPLWIESARHAADSPHGDRMHGHLPGPGPA